MICADARPLLDPYFDSELDITSALNVERHLQACPACSEHLRNLERLRVELTPEVFDQSTQAGLERLAASIKQQVIPTSPVKTRPRRIWNQAPLWAALAAAVVLAVVLPLRRADTGADRELVDSHVRSLMASHLVDVPSSDHHTVKPWFQGKVDFAPDVPELKEKGFDLIGGRLDVLSGKPTAALVYKHGAHFVNLWTSRSDSTDADPKFSVVEGYQVVRWNQGGMKQEAVTDMAHEELLQFVNAFRNRP